MSLTVTLNSVSSACAVDVRWSSSESSMAVLGFGVSQPQQVYLVRVTSGDVTAAGHEWTLIVRNSKTSALRLDLEQSGIVGSTPRITVKRCRATNSMLGDEELTVEKVGRSWTAAADNDFADRLYQRFSAMSLSRKPTVPSGDASGDDL